jgi:hypothetical protein
LSTLVEFEGKPYEVLIEGEEPARRRAPTVTNSTSVSDHLREQEAQVATYNRKLELDCSFADANFRRVSIEMESAQKDLVAARDVGDEERAAAAHGRIAELGAQKVQWQQQVNYANSQPKRQADRYTPETERWWNENPQFFFDPKLRQKAMGADMICRGEGLAPDTGEYFDRAGQLLGIGGNGRSNSRSSNPSGAVSVTLSKGEKERALDGSVVWNRGNTDAKGHVLKDGDPRIGRPVGISEYARRKAELQKIPGYYDKIG